MKLQIEPPFAGQWKHAYVVRNKENRNMVCLFNSNKDRTTIALARYRMAVKLGRMLREDEQVDHIDNDKTNDDINNLQILSAEENRAKYQESQLHDVHGTSSMYHKGCRCDLCKEYMRKCRKKCASYGRPCKNIDKVCALCGSTFMTDSSHRNRLFCSRICANKANASVRMLSQKNVPDRVHFR